jgi:hypothetical protein
MMVTLVAPKLELGGSRKERAWTLVIKSPPQAFHTPLYGLGYNDVDGAQADAERELGHPVGWERVGRDARAWRAVAAAGCERCVEVGLAAPMFEVIARWSDQEDS